MALLTASTKTADRKRILYALRGGQLGIIIGTHALLEDPVQFHALSVVVIDEQHRFGVRQRARLEAKAPEGRTPHVLHLTATPIPRTQRLLEFGAVERDRVARPAAGRQPIVTHIAETPRSRARLTTSCASRWPRYARRSSSARSWPTPRSSRRGRRSPNSSGSAPGRCAACVWSSCTARCRRRQGSRDGAVRERRRAGARRDHVIEVGIDVPNATVMLIEDADASGSPSCTSCAGASVEARTAARACCSGRRARHASRRSSSTATASAWPRSTSSCAARAS